MTMLQEKPVSAAHDLLILQRGEGLPPKLQDALQRKGFSSRIIKKYEDISATAADLADPILLVHCGSKPGAARYLKPLYSKTEILELPILVLGKDVDGLQMELSKHFGMAATLPLSCNPHEFLEALKYVSRAYNRESVHQRERPAKATEIIETPTLITTGIEEVSEEVLPPEKSHHLYKQAESMPALLFQQLNDFKLLKRSLGGGCYAQKNNAKAPRLEDLFEKDDPALRAAQAAIHELGKWVTEHLTRTAYLTDCILSSLHFERPDINHALRAVFLLSSAFGHKNQLLARKQYLGRGTSLLRKEVCSLIKDSALKLSLELHLPREANMVALLGRLVGREETVGEDPDSIMASAIMAADVTDRACFQSGSWSPRAAYALISRIKSGKMRDFHPAVLCCLIKLLGEAVSESGIAAHLLPKGAHNNPALLERAREIKTQPVSEGEAKVAIAALTPGMRLSRPLFSFDGRQILSEDLTLDQDLIWRIWQLSAVRPLNSPVVVRQESREKAEETQQPGK